MKVKCINQGNFKNITIGNEYEVISTYDNLYCIIANNGENLNYSKKYFEVISDPIIENIDEIKVIEKVKPEFNLSWNNENIVVEMQDANVILEYFKVASNCGVCSYHGINWLYENCDDFEMFKNIILSVIELIKDSGDRCMLILSTNYEHYKIWDVLDEIMDLKSEAVENPNSDMDVKVWIKYI